MSEETKIELFFPYYINQGRLLDIYAILNGGYSEYSEITATVNEDSKKSAKAEASVSGGFKLFNIGGKLSGDLEQNTGASNSNKEKRVQTVTSMLSIIKNTLVEKEYVKCITQSKVGDFVCLPVNLSINSVKSLISEMSELLKLCGNMQKLGATVKGVGKEIKDLDNLMKTLLQLFNGEEIFYEADEFAIIGNMFDLHLYQSVRSDIIGTDMMCLAQVKKIYPDGTELMKNTIFTKIKDNSAKERFIDIIKNITDGNFFDFESIAVSSIKNKPVYQLEIIALYQ